MTNELQDMRVERSDYGFYSKLAYRWAPIHYQYIDLSYIKRDLLCQINYDGDWDTSNNRDHIDDYDLIPVVYYGTAETGTHYYIVYCFYHADDATHENDLEGCLLIIQKEEEKLLGMISIAHFDFFSYVVDNRLQPGHESLDGELLIEDFDGQDHPMTKQEIDKHPFYAWGTMPWWAPWHRDSIDRIGIRYYPADQAFPQNEFKIDSFNKTGYPYILVDMLNSEGFWDKRDPKLNPMTFKSWGTFNSSTIGSAHAPWVWDDMDDNLTTGTIFFNPDIIAYRYFSGFGDFDSNYTKRMNGK